VAFRLASLLLARVLSWQALLARFDSAKNVHILVLRHRRLLQVEVANVRDQLGRFHRSSSWADIETVSTPATLASPRTGIARVVASLYIRTGDPNW
jgi:hypothetical protein